MVLQEHESHGFSFDAQAAPARPFTPMSRLPAAFRHPDTVAMTRILCPILVGRQDEQGQLAAAIEAGQRGRGGVVFVIGPAGIGKSRLIAEAAAQARARGMTVLLGRSVPAKIPVPYRPVAEALIAASPSGVMVESPDLAGFRTALGWIVPAWRDEASAASAESPIVVAEALLRALHAISGSRGCALFVEDMQWADPETLHAIEYLADHAASSSTLCICTLRDEPGTDAMDVVTRLDSRRAVDVIHVRPLSPDQVVDMAMSSLGTTALAPEIATVLREGAEGMPFLVEELLAAAAASGGLLRTSDGWQVSAPIRRLVPQSFATTVYARLDALAAGGRRFLGVAALLGRNFDWRIASRAADCTTSAAHALLEEAVALQLLAAQDDTFSFRHALTREAILSELLPSTRADLAGHCLDVLEQTEIPGEDWRHLAADLAEMSGVPDRAASFLLHAGHASLTRGALDTATAALERAAQVVLDAFLRADILEALAEARSAAGDLRSTQSAVESLLDVLAVIDAPTARRGHAHLLLARCAVTAAHFDLASQELARARRVAASAEDAGLAARVGAVAAQLAMGEGRSGEAEALALRAAADADATQQAEVVCEALEVASRCARMRDLDEAEDVGARALQVAEDAGLAFWRMRALYQLGVVEMFQSGGVEMLRRAREEAERLGAIATATSLDLEITAGLEAQFRLDEARETCGRCLETAHLLDLRAVEAVAHAFVAVIEAGRPGARGRMEAAIVRSLAIAGDHPEIHVAIWGDARAIASLAAEDRPRARQELKRAVATVGYASGVLPHLPVGLLALVVAVEGGEPDLSGAVGATRVMCLAAGYLAYARAVQFGRARRAVEAAEAAQRGDQHLAQLPWYRHLVHRLAAEAAIDDGWGDPTSWLTEAASFFDEAGNDRLASACRALLRRAGVKVARPTQAVKALPPSLRRAGVTPREAEVLALVGEGLSNGEIAARLYLSGRTVEQHVGGLKQKLALRNRAHLVAYAAGEATTAR
jgi:DNA-binding CsgD family transcriptional regulator/tetratricopeptide (TPR) repeat protein